MRARVCESSRVRRIPVNGSSRDESARAPVSLELNRQGRDRMDSAMNDRLPSPDSTILIKLEHYTSLPAAGYLLSDFGIDKKISSGRLDIDTFENPRAKVAYSKLALTRSFRQSKSSFRKNLRNLRARKLSTFSFDRALFLNNNETTKGMIGLVDRECDKLRLTNH